MNPTTRRVIKLALPTSFITTLLIGCSNTISSSGKQNEDYRKPEGSRSLPIEKYLLSNDEELILEKAKYSAARSCMERLEARFPPPAHREPFKLQMTERRYGITNRDEAKIHGYRVPAAGKASSTTEEEPLTHKQLRALFGVEQGKEKGVAKVSHINGKPIPEGGCMGEAERNLSNRQRVYGDGRLAMNISQRSFKKSSSDPRVRRAIEKWSSCMERNGHPYENPLTAGEDLMNGRSASEQERKVATIDSDCNREAKVAKTWFDVESDIQNGLIADHEKELDELNQIKKREIVNSRKELQIS
ncbi:hypothetical protein [Streptomyces sp. RK9]|uniref:hypothetical protein n=1 Tax=Streptomyces sp. RK9 TaxID=3239284 RepID=UPI00386F9006